MGEWRARLCLGHSIDVLRGLEESSVHCVVTSPPYYGLRDYGLEGVEWADGWVGCLGLEPTPDQYVAHLVEVFAAVARVLCPDGTLWLNLGDSYNGTDRGQKANTNKGQAHSGKTAGRWLNDGQLKPKDLVGIPWRVAFALQAAGWYLRSDIIWHKPNPMPSSVKDRCTSAHEYLFMFAHPESKGRYYYDGDAVKEPAVGGAAGNKKRKRNHRGSNAGKVSSPPWEGGPTRNRRDVWTITTKPFKGAHFAVMPPELVEPCILAGCPPGGVTLDPFGGAGTVALVALQHGRRSIYIDCNADYRDLAAERLRDV